LRINSVKKKNARVFVAYVIHSERVPALMVQNHETLVIIKVPFHAPDVFMECLEEKLSTSVNRIAKVDITEVKIHNFGWMSMKYGWT
jgi:hypothetical protein